MLLSTHAVPFYDSSVCHPIYPVAASRLVEVYRSSELENHKVLLVLGATSWLVRTLSSFSC